MWEAIAEILTNQNAFMVMILGIILLLILVILAKKGYIRINTGKFALGDDYRERAIIQQQTEWAHIYCAGLKGQVDDYSKSVTVTDWTTEIFVMPENALYWYGYINGIESVTNDNGWTTLGGIPSVVPVYNTNSITIENTDSTVVGIGTTSLISGGKISCWIVDGISAVSGSCGIMGIADNKVLATAQSSISSGLQYIRYTLPSTSYVYDCAWSYARRNDLYALWYE